MNSCIQIGIIGDYDGRPSHLATQEALRHCADRLNFELNFRWLPTKLLELGTEALELYDGLWCSPGSPYHSMNGALNGICYAREHNLPFLGTCGGFQHAVIEYGRNVLHIKELEDNAFDPYAPNDFITVLSCSLVGQTRNITISRNSSVFSIYDCHEISEKYNCSFGLGKDFQNSLQNNGFQIVGRDEEGDVRIMVLPELLFYIGTLYQPQLSSTPEKPHPLILEYLRCADRYHKSKWKD